MPLAIDLIANVVDYEGLENVLTRWETKKTSLLSLGLDRRSNLDKSIGLSLSSPRITSDSKTLLSLLSILPNGLSDRELINAKLPIPNILSCKAALLATSLAYQDGNKRLLALMPVREHIQQFLPPSTSLIHALCNHFHSLLQLYQKHWGRGQMQSIVNQITLNLGNLQEVLQQGLQNNDLHSGKAISCILSLNSFYRLTGRHHTSLMDYIHPILLQLSDRCLEISFITEVLMTPSYFSSSMQEQLIPRAIAHFPHVNDPLLECESFIFEP
jgi:hypothetical protein